MQRSLNREKTYSNAANVLTICEGKFHQVKRMFESVGKKVLYLKRLSMGTLILDDLLPPGAYRTLTAGEIRSLQTISKKETGDKE